MATRTTRSLTIGLGLAAAAMLGAAMFPHPASAGTDCRGDFAKLMDARQNSITRINAFKTAKPTAQAACQALTTLQGSETQLLSWVKANKEWCQIPDEVPNGLSESMKRSTTMRGQACGAAANQSKQIAKLKALQAQQAQGGGSQGAGAPGSGVKLPQGAL